jgi:predicted patatin/cPLA2 family phospholipase
MKTNLFKNILRGLRPEKPDISSGNGKVLILEGGGMRGVFLTGVLQAFTDHSFFPFDLVAGSSAGALTGCAYTAGQIYLSRDAFFGKLLSGKFIRPANIFNSDRHILDLDWMIDTVVKGPYPLDLEALRRACPVIITATDCVDDRPPETLYLNSKTDDIYTALKATAAIPVLYRGFVEYGHHRLLDGGLLDPIPFYRAMDMGYREEDIVVVLTRPKGYRKEAESFWVRSLYEAYYRDTRYRYLVRSLDRRYIRYNRILDDLENVYRKIQIIYPPEEFAVDRLTRDPKMILEGFEMGVIAGNAFMYPDKYR